MTITIDLPPDQEQLLAKRAAFRGQDLTTFVRGLVDREAAAPPSILEAAEPFARAVAESGMSEEEFTATIQQAIDEVRAERRARQETELASGGT